MKPSPISLVDYFATDLVLATKHEFVPDKPVQFIESEYIIEVALQRNEGAGGPSRCWQVTLEVRHQPGPETNFPYSYRIVLVGRFCVAPHVKTDDEERTVRIHGASVLYGMAREIARALTGRGPYRPVILPTVSFYEPRPTDSVGSALAPNPEPTTPAPTTPIAKRAKRKAGSFP